MTEIKVMDIKQVVVVVDSNVPLTPLVRTTIYAPLYDRLIDNGVVGWGGVVGGVVGK